jgi:hypothetical protein
MLKTVSRDVASWCWPYLVAKSSHVGVDVDGLACPLHVLPPIAVRRGDMTSCQAPSYPVV